MVLHIPPFFPSQLKKLGMMVVHTNATYWLVENTIMSILFIERQVNVIIIVTGL